MSNLTNVLVGLGFTLLAGCGNSSNTCVTGQSIMCACASGATGAQVCQSNGTYGTCSCASSDGGIPSGGDGGGQGGKRVFITSTGYPGNFGGSTVAADSLAAADMICQLAAQGALLGGKWKVWLSATGVNAIDRIADVGPWYALDGTKIFNNRDNLTTSSVNRLVVDEKGKASNSLPITVWTGTKTGGQQGNSNCLNWNTSSSTYFGVNGYGDSPPYWTDSGATASCSNINHLICFEQ